GWRMDPTTWRRPSEHGQPWQDAHDEDRNEIPPRALTVMLAGKKAGEMFMDEKKVDELAIAHRHQDKPRRGNDQKKDEAGKQMQSAPECPIAVDQRVEHQCRARQHDPDESFRQHG